MGKIPPPKLWDYEVSFSRTFIILAIAYFFDLGKRGYLPIAFMLLFGCSNSGPRQLFRFASGFAFLEFLAQTRNCFASLVGRSFLAPVCLRHSSRAPFLTASAQIHLIVWCSRLSSSPLNSSGSSRPATPSLAFTSFRLSGGRVGASLFG